jgi:hypothetical protein
MHERWNSAEERALLDESYRALAADLR